MFVVLLIHRCPPNPSNSPDEWWPGGISMECVAWPCGHSLCPVCPGLGSSQARMVPFWEKFETAAKWRCSCWHWCGGRGNQEQDWPLENWMSSGIQIGLRSKLDIYVNVWEKICELPKKHLVRQFSAHLWASWANFPRTLNNAYE